MTTIPTNGKVQNCPYWEKAVRLYLKNPESIIADPSILSDEYNEWMLQEASIIQREELEKFQADQELAQWAEDHAEIIAYRGE